MDERIQLILEVMGKEGVDQLRAKLGELNAEGGELAAAFGRGDLTLEEFDAEVKRNGASVKNLETALRQLDAAQQRAEVASRKTATAMAAAPLQQQESDVYELADAYEVLGVEMTTVLTTASQIPRSFDFST